RIRWLVARRQVRERLIKRGFLLASINRVALAVNLLPDSRLGGRIGCSPSLVNEISPLLPQFLNRHSSNSKQIADVPRPLGRSRRGNTQRHHAPVYVGGR